MKIEKLFEFAGKENYQLLHDAGRLEFGNWFNSLNKTDQKAVMTACGYRNEAVQEMVNRFAHGEDDYHNLPDDWLTRLNDRLLTSYKEYVTDYNNALNMLK